MPCYSPSTELTHSGMLNRTFGESSHRGFSPGYIISWCVCVRACVCACVRACMDGWMDGVGVKVSK